MKKFLTRLLDWFSKKINRPRPWSKIEWEKLSSLEKSFIWYKYVLFLRGTGSAEIDQLTDPAKELILYGGIILSNVSIAFLYLEIELSYFSIIGIVAITCIILWVVNFVLQIRLGDWKEIHDLIALEQEIGNRNNKFCRDLRKATMKAAWRGK